MTSLLSVDSRWWQAAGWTMLHFLWLGTVIALFAAAGRLALRRAAPRERYAFSLAMLALLVVAPAGIYAWVLEPGAAPIGSLRELQFIESDPGAAQPDFPDAGAARPLAVSRAAGAAKPQAMGGAAREEGGREIGVERRRSSSEWMATLLARSRAGLAAASRQLPWFWLAGSPVTFLLLLAGLTGAERLRKRCRPIDEGELWDACRRLSAALRIARRVALGVSDRVGSPILIGIVRPLILLPPAAVTGWTPAQIEMILLHELAHVRRWDNLVNLLQRLAEAFLFFHPAVWWLSARVRLEREHCCDALVLAHTGQPAAYAETLAALALALPALAPHRLAATTATHQLVARIRHILNLEDRSMQVSRKLFVSVTAALIISGLSLAYWAQSTTAVETPPSETANPSLRTPTSFASEASKRPVAEKTTIAQAERKAEKPERKETAIERALLGPTDVKFIETPFKNAILFLMEQHKIKVVLDEAKMKANGIASDTPITLQLSGVSLQSVLNLMLEQYQMDWAIDGDLLRITTREEAAKMTTSRGYAIEDLVAAGVTAAALERAIRATIDPGSWKTNSLRLDPATGELNVTHNRHAHAAIESLLRDLRTVALNQRPATPNPVEEHIRRALDASTDVEFIETPLKECLLFLKEQHNINLLLDEQKVADEGVATDTPINLFESGLSLRSILDNILRKGRLDYFVANEIMKVTTVVETSRRLETHVYDVRALVKAGFGQDLLRDTLTQTLAPSSWTSAGGVGVIESLPGCIVIRQSVAVHRQIADLLRRLARQGRAVFGGPHWSLTPAEKAENVMNGVLDRQIALELRDTRLDQIVELLAGPRMPIVLDIRALEKERIDPRQMVNLKVDGQPLAKVLDLVLEPLKLDWAVVDEVVWVTTRRQMDELLQDQLRTYDVLDLINRTTGTTWTAAKLVDTVIVRVEPDSWDNIGGPGTICEIRGILVVTQTPRNHRKIAEVLAELRKVPR